MDKKMTGIFILQPLTSDENSSVCIQARGACLYYGWINI
uniref:Uncharacterized protein n=1 Tax=Arundo donax TaxID=35708 RepID=A0A0A9HMS4_ARUDO